MTGLMAAVVVIAAMVAFNVWTDYHFYKRVKCIKSDMNKYQEKRSGIKSNVVELKSGS